MRVRTKKIVWLVVGIGFALPFILQTTLYPFFRFGMFAEPVQYSIQDEQFVLMRMLPTGEAVSFVPEKIGIGKNKLDYLLRNYYYRNETQKLIQHLQTLLPDSILESSVKVIRITGKDTLIVGEIIKP